LIDLAQTGLRHCCWGTWIGSLRGLAASGDLSGCLGRARFQRTLVVLRQEALWQRVV